jgi:hypothetical protein
MITRINPPELGTPPGYSQIVEVPTWIISPATAKPETASSPR